MLRLVAGQMQDGVLAELAEVFADADDAPVNLMNDLANHSFEVAAPVLARSKALDEQALLKIVNHQSQQHIKAVAQRPEVSEKVADAIVRLGDDFALDALIRNEGAQISRPTMEVAVDRAQRNSALHEAVVKRRAVSSPEASGSPRSAIIKSTLLLCRCTSASASEVATCAE